MPLGTGGSDLDSPVRPSRRAAYSGDFVLQVASGADRRRGRVGEAQPRVVRAHVSAAPADDGPWACRQGCLGSRVDAGYRLRDRTLVSSGRLPTVITGRDADRLAVASARSSRSGVRPRLLVAWRPRRLGRSTACSTPSRSHGPGRLPRGQYRERTRQDGVRCGRSDGIVSRQNLSVYRSSPGSCRDAVRGAGSIVFVASLTGLESTTAPFRTAPQSPRSSTTRRTWRAWSGDEVCASTPWRQVTSFSLGARGNDIWTSDARKSWRCSSPGPAGTVRRA